MWPGSNGAITRRISRIVSAEKRRAEESGVVGLMGGVSVVLLRPHCILTSEEYPMKTHGNQWLVTLQSLPISHVEAHTLAPEVQTLCSALTEDNPQRCGLTSS